ncbi:hypothetical protein [Nostoc sp. TCL26-01]|uniref:hypothetical protein n=1 Tax=Nostoc sp. TCL26-01 TaxID=2576904 RepID=UPI0015BBD33A|nr:hypothetical protein [Nostoc sp. TCL26-01]QLE59629.1 hypothetical protein FD725_29695 [Nostoc sp. TCL26-01]
MTHPQYSHQHLQLKSIARLQQIYSEIGCTTTVRDRRCKDSWISAIADYKAQRIHRIAPATLDEQATAQAELENFIADQAEAVAPEELTTVEINRHHFEVYAGKRLIAYITYDHDEFVTQPWVVMVSGIEIFRHTTLPRCQRYVQWHLNNSQLNSIPESREFASRMNQSPHHVDNCELFQNGTLNPLTPAEVPEVPKISEISFYDQEAFVDGELVASISYDHGNYQDLYWRVLVNNAEIFRDTTAARCHSYVKQQYQQGTLPVQEPFVEPYTTGNEIMAQIAQECEKHGLELLDDGIYHNNKRLVEFVYKNGVCCYVRASLESQQIVPELLSEDVSCEELLDKPFHLLTAEEWELLREYQPTSDSRELVVV